MAIVGSCCVLLLIATTLIHYEVLHLLTARFPSRLRAACIFRRKPTLRLATGMYCRMATCGCSREWKR